MVVGSKYLVHELEVVPPVNSGLERGARDCNQPVRSRDGTGTLQGRRLSHSGHDSDKAVNPGDHLACSGYLSAARAVGLFFLCTSV